MHQLAVSLKETADEVKEFLSMLRCPGVLDRVEGDIEVGKTNRIWKRLKDLDELRNVQLRVAQIQVSQQVVIAQEVSE